MVTVCVFVSLTLYLSSNIRRSDIKTAYALAVQCSDVLAMIDLAEFNVNRISNSTIMNKTVNPDNELTN